MSFHPRMTSRLSGISILDELRSRSWGGVVADVWGVHFASDAHGEYVSPHPRLFVPLEMRGDGRFLLRESVEQSVDAPSITYIPAGVSTSSRVDRAAYICHLDLHFDVAALRQRLGIGLDERKLKEPRVAFHNDALLAICRLLADECRSDEPLNDLYGDGLVSALLVKLFEIEPRRQRSRTKLSSGALKAVIDYIEANWTSAIRLNELAPLVGMSESQFSHAFKASTGMPPHRWHLNVRVKKVQELLAISNASLTEIAVSSGFADQAHLTRVFKSVTGTTPALWGRRATLDTQS